MLSKRKQGVLCCSQVPQEATKVFPSAADCWEVRVSPSLCGLSCTAHLPPEEAKISKDGFLRALAFVYAVSSDVMSGPSHSLCIL